MRKLLFFIPIMILFLGKPADTFSQVIAADSPFNQPALIITGDHSYQLKVNDQQTIEIPSEWLAPEKEIENEVNNYVSSFNYLEEIECFPVNDHLTGIHLSSYDYMKTGGSAFAASGRDKFLILDHKTNKIFPGLISLEITKSRLRSGGLHAKTAHFFILDIDQDGYRDIGIIHEMVEYNTYFQKPIIWYVFDPLKIRWIHHISFDGKRPEKLQKLKYIEVDDATPVDDIMKILMRNSNDVPGAMKYLRLKK